MPVNRISRSKSLKCFGLCCVFLISCMSYFIMLHFSLRLIGDVSSQTTETCIFCEHSGAYFGVRSAPKFVKCCPSKASFSFTPAPELLVQKRSAQKSRIGAMLSVDQTALKDNKSKIVWSHRGPINFVDGLKHVTHYFGSHTFDCLEIITEGRYLTSIQLTIRYTITTPLEGIRGYFTLTNFRRSIAFVIAKVNFFIPDSSQRESDSVKQSLIMIRSALLSAEDRLCVTMSHPDLIYVSSVDNFFGLILL